MRAFAIEIIDEIEGVISRLRDVVTGEYEEKKMERAYIDRELEAYEMELQAACKGENIQSFREFKRRKEGLR